MTRVKDPPPDLSGHRGAVVISALHGNHGPIPQGPAPTITPVGLVIIGSIGGIPLGQGRDAMAARQPAGTRRLRAHLALSGARSAPYDRAAPPGIQLGIGPAPPGLRF